MTVPQTLNQLFLGAIDRWGSRPAAMRFKREGRWHEIRHQELAERVRAASLGLLELGVEPGQRVAILSENRPEWAVTDYACLMAGTTDVPIYPTLPAKQIVYILRDSGARVAVVSTAEQLAKIREIRAQVPELQWVVTFDAAPNDPGTITFEQLLERGRVATARYPNWKTDGLAVRPDALATLIYTSGTTGDPKGVMLSHGNITSNVLAGIAALPVGPEDEFLSLLPLSHIFERTTGHYTMLQAGAVINYAESMDTVPQNLLEVRPTVMAGVPRLYEKIYAKALETAAHGPPVRRRIFFWAKRVGETWTDLRLGKRRVPLGLGLQRTVADRLVFSKIRARTGGRIRYFVSGGAPLNADIAKFFYAAGLPILEGYGLTETSPTITVNRLDHIRLGTVGLPVEGAEVRIASDGEILTRGPNVMLGYFNHPEATREAIDAEGWFHTGDVGEIDADGFLKITDRKKDLIVTAGGKNIAPQPIEGLLRQNPFIGNAVLLGDKRKFPMALLVPNFERLELWARGAGLAFTDHASLVALPQVKAHLEAEAKKHLRDLAHFEVPKRFLIVPREFSIESGELTPKLSVKRRVVENHYRSEIDAIYAAAEAAGDRGQTGAEAGKSDR